MHKGVKCNIEKVNEVKWTNPRYKGAKMYLPLIFNAMEL